MARRSSQQTEWLQLGRGHGYVDRVQRPLQCLIFIAPLLVIYQVGAIVYPSMWEGQSPTHVMAFVLMLRFFAIFGAAGSYLPLGTVVAVLLAWHLARHDKWKWEPRLYAGMAAESMAWGIPFFVIGLAVLKHMAAAAPTNGGPLPWQTAAVLSVGAGVYEELLFRLVGITVLHTLLVGVLEWKLENAIPVIILTSAILFSLYHYLGDEPYTLGRFFYLTAFGVYCAAVYLFRGFGIVVGAHAVYDLLVVGMIVYRGQ